MADTPGSATYSSMEPTEGLTRETKPSESVALPSVIKGEDWPGPVLDGLNPDSMEIPAADAWIVLHGTGFTADSLVIWDEDERKPDYVNPGKVRVLVTPPEEPGEVPVAIMERGEISNTLLFTFTQAPEPEADAKVRSHRKR